MRCEPEAYMTLLLWELDNIPAYGAASFVKSYGSLLSRYLNISLLADNLAGKDTAPAEIARRASEISGRELFPEGDGGKDAALSGVFSRLAVGTETAGQRTYYGWSALSVTDIFPSQFRTTDYTACLSALDAEMETVAKAPPADFDGLISVLDTVFQKVFWSVPGGKGVTDVSLYDRMRVTACVGVCLMTEGVDTAMPFCLAGGDFSGIQTYIFGVAHTATDGVAKRLRARSFLVNVLVQGLAFTLCRRFGLSVAHILMQSGGNFRVLIPNTPETAASLEDFSRRTAQDLFRRFRGEISFNIAWSCCGPDGLADYDETVATLQEKLRTAKNRPFSGVLHTDGAWAEDEFELYSDLKEKTTCRSCLKRLIPRETEFCPACAEQEALGQQLPGAETLWISEGGGTYKLWDDYYLSLKPEQAEGKLLRVEKLNDFRLSDGKTRFPLGVRLMTNHIPRKNTGAPLTFTEIAAKAAGSAKLGVLKMDVDNLGYLFARGLRKDGRHLGTVSRTATMSRMLELFFSGYVGQLLTQRYPDVYSVFSGGDDLFLIGPWDKMPGLALEIRQTFCRFTGNNPCVTVSAAICLADPKEHMALLGDAAEEALSQVKNSAPAYLYPEKRGRNGIFFNGDIFSWEDFDAQMQQAAGLYGCAGNISTGILYRIERYSAMYRRFVIRGDLTGLMCQPMFVYDRKRNYPPDSPAFLKYAKSLETNGCKPVNKNLFFASTAVAYCLQLRKERKNSL